jgi:hypothetical protein
LLGGGPHMRPGGSAYHQPEVQIRVAIMHELGATAATRLMTVSYISVRLKELR